MATRPTASLLDQFAAVIGEELAILLSIKFGGKRLYIPQPGRPQSELAQVIGPRAADAMGRRYGGVTFEMPLERGRRERILLLSRDGKSVREIAEAIGCTERHVKAVRAHFREHGGVLVDPGPKPDPHQIGLFESAHDTTLNPNQE